MNTLRCGRSRKGVEFAARAEMAFDRVIEPALVDPGLRGDPTRRFTDDPGGLEQRVDVPGGCASIDGSAHDCAAHHVELPFGVLRSKP